MTKSLGMSVLACVYVCACTGASMCGWLADWSGSRLWHWGLGELFMWVCKCVLCACAGVSLAHASCVVVRVFMYISCLNTGGKPTNFPKCVLSVMVVRANDCLIFLMWNWYRHQNTLPSEQISSFLIYVHTHTHTDPHLYFLSITLSLHMVPFSLSSSLFTDIHIDISSLSSYRLSSCSMIVFLFQEKYTPFTNRCRSMQCLQCWLIF